LCLLKGIQRSGRTTPVIPNLSTNKDEWSASHLGQLTPRERTPRTHVREKWIDLSAHLDTLEKGKFLAPDGN